MPVYIQLATDNFQRANELPLTDSMWFGSFNANPRLQLLSNQVVPRAAGLNACSMWNPSNLVFPDDQYAESKISVIPTSAAQDFGVGCRITNDLSQGTLNNRPNGYFFKIIRGATTSSYVLINIGGGGTVTTLATVSGVANPVVGDVARLEMQGTILTGFYNGVQIIQASDTTFAHGQPGLVMSGLGAVRPGTKLFNAGLITGIDPVHRADAFIIQAQNTANVVHSADCYVYSTQRGLIEATLFIETKAGGPLLIETKVGRTLPVETVVGLEPLVVTRKIGKTLPVSTRVGGTFLIE